MTTAGQTYFEVQVDAGNTQPADVALLERAIGEIVGKAKQQWPGVTVAPEHFARFLSERAPDEGDSAAALRLVHGTDLYLACACARQDPIAVGHFERAIMPSVAPAVGRIDPDREFGREVAEEVRVKLLVPVDGRPARIAGYIGRGPLTSWVQVTAMRTAYSMKRVKTPKDSPADLERLARAPFIGDDPEIARMRKELAGPFREAILGALGSLPPRDRNVLRMYLLEDVSAESIGRMYQVHRATVARWISRAERTVLEGIRQRLQAALHLRDSELDSIMRLVDSQLDLSLVSVMTDGVGE